MKMLRKALMVPQPPVATVQMVRGAVMSTVPTTLLARFLWPGHGGQLYEPMPGTRPPRCVQRAKEDEGGGGKKGKGKAKGKGKEPYAPTPAPGGAPPPS